MLFYIAIFRQVNTTTMFTTQCNRPTLAKKWEVCNHVYFITSDVVHLCYCEESFATIFPPIRFNAILPLILYCLLYIRSNTWTSAFTINSLRQRWAFTTRHQLGPFQVNHQILLEFLSKPVHEHKIEIHTVKLINWKHLSKAPKQTIWLLFVDFVLTGPDTRMISRHQGNPVKMALCYYQSLWLEVLVRQW